MRSDFARPIGKLKLYKPAVVFNGAAVYDFGGDSFLWHEKLPREARDVLARLMEEFPSAAVEVLIDRDVYVINNNDFERTHILHGSVEPIYVDSLSCVPDKDVIKLLFIDDPNVIDRIIVAAEKYPCPGARWVRSDRIFFEMLPQGIDKGVGMRKLAEVCGLTDKFVVAAGDYYNDFEMLRDADMAFVPRNAPDDIKAVATRVMCDNNEGLIADVIDFLEDLKL
ncbi:hypothetical protein FACS1894120_2280 [Clostridia bacterium]|nr:hypothetical protein FACS1894120_2280 [Clostridia bacterium]